MCYGSLLVFYLITKTHSSRDEMEAFLETFKGKDNKHIHDCPVLDFFRSTRNNP